MRHPATPWLVFATILSTAALGVVARPAGALGLRFEPPAPSWLDPVVVTVEGVDCEAPLRVREVDASSIDLELGDCPPGLPVGSGNPTVALPPLPPGAYVVRLHIGPGVVTGALAVGATPRLGIEVPSLVRSDETAHVRLVSFASCQSYTVQRLGSAIAIDYYESCNFEPLGPELSVLDVPLGPLPPGKYEVQVRDRTREPAWVAPRILRVRDPGACFPSDTALCLADGRFRVAATWRSFDGRTGVAHALPLGDDEDGGLLWFFGRDNAELTVKVLDGCAVNARWWAFLSSSSTVEYHVTVTDTKTGTAHTYDKALGAVPALIADTASFEVCP